MIIVMKSGAARNDINNVIAKIEEFGYKSHPIIGTDRTVVAAVGDARDKARLSALSSMKGVESVMPILRPFKLASIETRKRTRIKIGKISIGGEKLCIMAGPCSVESEEQIINTAKAVKRAGAHMLRGGAYKPRTSPYSFQGLAEEGLKFLDLARKETGLYIVTEVMNPREIDLVAKYADMLQIGARNTQNFSLLKEIGRVQMPVLLKRGLATTIDELLMAAEYIMSEGNYQVVLCERGIRTFETATRNTFDVSAIPVLKMLSHLPVIADPSHSGGRRELVAPLSKAAVAAGADGLIIEVHPNPERAYSDGEQSLPPEQFKKLMLELGRYAALEGRSV
ncbi:MAG: 3-deoxy-7-phosphoheptulonate synthase [bacterium]